ncbi:MAG: 1-deoxy-D-xylulose-5-phosphate synthase, partial [Gammaproteobacteria bacterium]
PVLFAIDRAGLVGGDGPTHAGAFDVSFLRCLPGLVIMAPADENETRQMLYTGFKLDQPVAVRYPRGRGPGVSVIEHMSEIPLGLAQRRREGSKVAFLAFGAMLAPCLEAAKAIDASVVNMRFVKPLDDDMVRMMAAEHQLLVTVDENAIGGGAGSAVNESLAQQGIEAAVLNLGLPDRFIEHGEREQMLHAAGLDADGILAQVKARLELRPSPNLLDARLLETRQQAVR